MKQNDMVSAVLTIATQLCLSVSHPSRNAAWTYIDETGNKAGNQWHGHVIILNQDTGAVLSR